MSKSCIINITQLHLGDDVQNNAISTSNLNAPMIPKKNLQTFSIQKENVLLNDIDNKYSAPGVDIKSEVVIDDENNSFLNFELEYKDISEDEDDNSMVNETSF